MEATTAASFSPANIYAKILSASPIHWIALLAFSAWMLAYHLLFDHGKDATFRRESRHVAAIFNAVVFSVLIAAYIVLEQGSLDGLWLLPLLAPGVFILWWIGDHSEKLCDLCGSPVRSQFGATLPNTCRNCGAILRETPDLPEEL